MPIVTDCAADLLAPAPGVILVVRDLAGVLAPAGGEPDEPEDPDDAPVD